MQSDSKRIKQVLLNLVQNALKFTFEGSITINITLVDEQDLLDLGQSSMEE
jgi:signal transduction histidine kinase